MNHEKQKETKWIKIYHIKTDKLDLLTRGSKMLFPERSTKMTDNSEKINSIVIVYLNRDCTFLKSAEINTVNSHLADTLLLWTFPITDKIQIPSRRGLTGNSSRYYGLPLLRTLKDVPRGSAITRVDCS